MFASSAKSRRGKATFDPSSKVRGKLRRRHRRRARRDPRLRDIFSARSTLLGVPVCEMTTRKRAVAARYSALCAGDETIKEQRGRCISVFGRACGADDVEATPDFRNALERSAPRTAKGESGKTPWPRSGSFDPVSALQTVKILLYRMPGIVTPLLLPSRAQSNRRVHEYRDAWFHGLHSFKSLLARPFDLPSYYVYFTLEAEARAKVLLEYARLARDKYPWYPHEQITCVAISLFFSCAKDLIVNYRFEIASVISPAKQPFLRDSIGYRKNGRGQWLR